MAIASPRYNIRKADGTLCCQGNDYSKLCAACRAKADGCDCNQCKADRNARHQHQQAPALFGDVLSMYNLNAAGNNGRPQHNAAAATVPAPPSMVDHIRAARGLPPLKAAEPQMQTTGVPAPPSMLDAILARRDAARPHQGERR